MNRKIKGPTHYKTPDTSTNSMSSKTEYGSPSKVREDTTRPEHSNKIIP